MTIGSDRSFTT